MLFKICQSKMLVSREMYIAETMISSTWKFSGNEHKEWVRKVKDAFLAFLWYHQN